MIEDDVSKDPDWMSMPLYNRIQKLENKPKLSVQRLTFKIEPNEIKCACNTKCSTWICTCCKNSVICNNCNCNPEKCQNKDTENLRTTLFSDVVKNESTCD